MDLEHRLHDRPSSPESALLRDLFRATAVLAQEHQADTLRLLDVLEDIVRTTNATVATLEALERRVAAVESVA